MLQVFRLRKRRFSRRKSLPQSRINIIKRMKETTCSIPGSTRLSTWRPVEGRENEVVVALGWKKNRFKKLKVFLCKFLCDYFSSISDTSYNTHKLLTIKMEQTPPKMMPMVNKIKKERNHLWV